MRFSSPIGEGWRAARDEGSTTRVVELRMDRRRRANDPYLPLRALGEDTSVLKIGAIRHAIEL